MIQNGISHYAVHFDKKKKKKTLMVANINTNFECFSSVYPPGYVAVWVMLDTNQVCCFFGVFFLFFVGTMDGWNVPSD